MAVAVETDSLIRLLEEAVRRGAVRAWVSGDLAVGRAADHALFTIDFASEALVPSGRTKPGRVARRARGEAVEPATPLSPDASAPSCPDPDAWMPPRGRRTGHFTFILDGTRYDAPSQKALLLRALAAIERKRPGTLERLSAEKGRSKRVVARDRNDLYAGAPRNQVFSSEIPGGWWVATNNNFSETERHIRRAAFHAGLEVEIVRPS